MSVLWIDLETTGLDPVNDRVLEVAAIFTNDKLEEVACFQTVTNEIRKVNLDEVDPYVVEMHSKNGLWIASLEATDGTARRQKDGTYKSSLDQTVRGVDKALSKWLEDLMYPDVVFIDRGKVPADEQRKRQPQLAGSTIGFDKEFMRYHLPQTFALLNYRSIDVSSFNEIARRFWPEIWEARPRTTSIEHRAMADIEASLSVMRYYTETLGKVKPA